MSKNIYYAEAADTEWSLTRRLVLELTQEGMGETDWKIEVGDNNLPNDIENNQNEEKVKRWVTITVTPNNAQGSNNPSQTAGYYILYVYYNNDNPKVDDLAGENGILAKRGFKSKPVELEKMVALNKRMKEKHRCGTVEKKKETKLQAQLVRKEQSLHLAQEKLNGQLIWESWETKEGLENWIKQLQIEIKQINEKLKQGESQLQAQIEVPVKQ